MWFDSFGFDLQNKNCARKAPHYTNWCSGRSRPAASHASGLNRSGLGFPTRTILDGLSLIHIDLKYLHCATRTLLEVAAASCCVLLDFKELKRHMTPHNGSLASHQDYFSLAITRTLSSSASWTLPYFSFSLFSVSANLKKVCLLKSPALASCVQCWRCFLLLYQACVFFLVLDWL